MTQHARLWHSFPVRVGPRFTSENGVTFPAGKALLARKKLIQPRHSGGTCGGYGHISSKSRNNPLGPLDAGSSPMRVNQLNMLRRWKSV